MNKSTQPVFASSLNNFKKLAVFCSLFLVFGVSFGQVSITSLPQTHTENFNGLSSSAATSWTDNTTATLQNWYISPTITSLSTSTGTNISGAVLNLGVAGVNLVTDRAIGCLQSGGNNQFFGLRMKNNSATAIGSFSITFTGEQWRSFNAGSLLFNYQVGATVTSLTAGTWIAATAFDFAAIKTSTGTPLDGNDSANRTIITNTLTVSVPAGSEIMFRWSRNSNSSPILAVDDLSITANPATSIPTVTTTTITSITTTTASSGGNVTADGGATVSARGVYFGTTTAPTSGTSNGTGTGTFTSSLTSLSPNTKYYYRAYATNSAGTGYGSESNFYTLANVPSVLTVSNPQVTTLNVQVTSTTQNSNPAATVYAIHETSTNQFVQANGALGATAVWQTASVWSTTTVTGLTQNTTYTFEAKARNGASVETAYGTSVNGTTLANQTTDFCNVQSPTSQTIEEGSTFNVYAQALKSGLTEAAGQATGLVAWIGYSTTNSNPNTGSWTWIATTFNNQVGNNDEFVAALGSGLTPGTYYYASRFQIGSGTYTYGGTGGNWNNDNAVLTVNSNLVDYCNVAPSGTNNSEEGNVFTITSEVYEPGITPGAGQGAGITAWIGYNSSNNNPNGLGWTWVSATYNSESVNNDVYKIDLPANLALGTYYFASRYQKTGSTQYQYGGTNGSPWSTNGVLNVVSNKVDFCNIQSPVSGNITQGDVFNVSAEVQEPSITGDANLHTGITAWIGHSTTNSNPNTIADWTWVSATRNVAFSDGSKDEYTKNIALGLTPATYYYASRFQKTGSTEYQYGGTSGVWNNDNGTLVVNQPIPVVTAASLNGTYNTAFTYNVIATNSPTAYVLSSGTLPTGLTLNTTTGAITGTPTAAGSFTANVTATNSGGTSIAAALSFTIAKANQTITFGVLPSKTVGNAAFTLTATASSGLTVAYASSNSLVATVLGNTVTIVGAGTTTITASQMGNANYNPATNVDQSLVVNYPVIAGWDFTGVLSTAPPATFVATTFDSKLDNTGALNNITRGATANASGANNSFRTVGFENNGIATTNTDYFQTTLKTDLGYSLNLSNITALYSGTASFYASPGVTSQYAYSLDGTNFTLIGSPVVSVTVSPTPINVDLSGVSALQNVASGTTVYIRYYASGQTTTGGWGFVSAAAGTNGLAFTGAITCTQPTAFNVTGGGSGCANTGVAIGLSGSQVGISYQLKDGVTNVGSPVAGTGSAISFPNQTATGTYTVVGSNTNGTCNLTTSMTGNAVIIVNPTPNGTLSNGGAVCAGTQPQLTFTASAGTGPFTLVINGQTYTNITSGTAFAATGTAPTVTTTYSVTSIAGQFCNNPSPSASTTVTVNPTPNGTLTNGGAVCSGTQPQLIFTASAGTGPFTLVINGQTYTGVVSGTAFTATGTAPTVTTTYTLTSITGQLCNNPSPTASTSVVNPNTWTGATNNLWNLASNWSCGVVPDGSKDVLIPSGTPTLNVDYTVPTGTTLTVSGTGSLTVNPANTLTISGTAAFNDKNIILKSDATGTASIGQVTGTISGATNVTVERYIPAKRVWRTLTAPLKGANGSLYATWQNNGTVTANTGVEIWGPAGTNMAVGPNYSVLNYTPTGWANVTNTTTANLFDASKNNAYLVFVTGHYGSGNISSTIPATITTLKATGTLITGDVNYTGLIDTKHTLIGNPYASPLSPSALLTGATNLINKFWVYDPALATAGAYVSYDAGLGLYSNNTGSYTSSTTAIQSGQAFFVRAAPTTTGSFTISENKKSTAVSNVFGKSTNQTATSAVTASIFRVGFYKQVNESWNPLDGAIAGFYPTANTDVDTDDGKKFANGSENIAFVRNNTTLSSEHYTEPQALDELFMRVWNTNVGNYKLKLNTEQFTVTNVAATLVDLFTGTQTPIALDGTVQEYPFAVTAATASTGDRFKVVFSNAALGNQGFNAAAIRVYPNPVSNGMLNVQLPQGDYANYNYEMVNALGQIVRSSKIELLSSNQFVVDTKVLPSSWYVLRILNAGKAVYQTKVIVAN